MSPGEPPPLTTKISHTPLSLVHHRLRPEDETQCTFIFYHVIYLSIILSAYLPFAVISVCQKALPVVCEDLHAWFASEFSLLCSYKHQNAHHYCLCTFCIWLLCLNPIHCPVCVSAGCLHIPAAVKVPPESGALHDCKTTCCLNEGLLQ